ncbi:hypothetical protein SLS62_010700 [Diatrype stigma]|uniref:CASTOR ACT domain-containing protein n=1 Tax=Diatrype stigma TaxID=117547 RepID=A0AAN9U8Q9_9PEZI
MPPSKLKAQVMTSIGYLKCKPNFYSIDKVVAQVLLPHGGIDCFATNGNDDGVSVDNKHGFLNISITPIECSVVCHSSWARNVFEPSIKRLPRDAASRVSISKDAYLILSVISGGMDAGSRVMELTSPLAMSGVPIFFITTYYSDFILVPSKDRNTVVQALQARGFEFSEDMSAFVSPTAMSHARGKSSGSDHPHHQQPPSTPPPSTVAELQKRTFELLKKRSVTPYIQPGLSLVQCAGRDQSQFVDNIGHQSSSRGSRSHNTDGYGSGNGNGYGNGNGGEQQRKNWLDEVDTKLYTSLISVLAMQPRFLSITLAQEDAPSLLMDKTLLPAFGDALVGDNTDADLVPIFLDLAGLPLEATGIVSGVAGRLVSEMSMVETGVSGELSYLSTARAGAVILSKEQSIKALEVLNPLLVKGS